MINHVITKTLTKIGLIVCFLLGFLIRLIPEVLSFPHPIGFDTIDYAARIQKGVILYHWSFLLLSLIHI